MSSTSSENDAGNFIPIVTIPIIEEQLEISKRVVDTGGVRLIKRVEEREQTVDEPLQVDAVEIVRVPINRAVDQPVAVRTEGELTIISVHEEVTLITKQLIVTEEIHIRKKSTTIHRPIDVNLRRETIAIEDFAVPRMASPLAPAGQNGTER